MSGAAPSSERPRLRFAPARLLTMRPGGTAPSATNGALPRAVLTDLANRGVRFCGLFVLVYVRCALLNRGRRRSRRWMTEQGAAADNADRDGAPGGAGPFAGARASRKTHQAGSRKPG